MKKNAKINPKVKSFNLGTSIAEESGVFMRDTSCTCDECISGYMLKCETRTSGCHENYSLTKNVEKHIQILRMIAISQTQMRIFNMIPL